MFGDDKLLYFSFRYNFIPILLSLTDVLGLKLQSDFANLAQTHINQYSNDEVWFAIADMLFTLSLKSLKFYTVLFLLFITSFFEAKADVLSFLEYANLTNYYEELTYKPCKFSFLEYMLRLHEEDDFAELECVKPNYQLTTYHTLVYLYVCVFKNQHLFKLFCNQIQNPNENLETSLNEQSTFNSSYLNANSLEPESLPRDLSDIACHYINNYVSIRDNFKANIEKNVVARSNDSILLLKYNENLLEDVPFCNPFSCPYWKSGEKIISYIQTVYECMPVSCQAMFWVILTLDIVFTLAIIAANMVIITVVKKTPQLLTPHG